MPSSLSAVEQLRNETAALRRQVEAEPFFAALQERTHDRRSLAAFLQALGLIHDSLGLAQTRAPQPALALLWTAMAQGEALLRQDLARWADLPNPVSAYAAVQAAILGAYIERRRLSQPLSLVGYLFVLVEALPGRTTLAHHESALSYFAPAQNHPEREQILALLNTTLAAPAVQTIASGAARELLNGLQQIIVALHPLRTGELRTAVTAFNPDAGRHRIPEDLREVRAAMRAGEQTWHHFPYYERRYGARGERFTWSDSLWLATLVDLDQAIINRQILWLGGMLAARGMPQWMLEVHLQMLRDELSAAVPEKQLRYTRLGIAATQLGDLRRQFLSDSTFQTLAQEFEAAVGSPWNQQLQRAGELVVAAVLDEAAGLADALSSLHSWMTDPTRFPARWITTVERTIAKTQALIASGRQPRNGKERIRN
jgi:hypothetical protein